MGQNSLAVVFAVGEHEVVLSRVSHHFQHFAQRSSLLDWNFPEGTGSDVGFVLGEMVLPAAHFDRNVHTGLETEIQSHRTEHKARQTLVGRGNSE